MHVICAFLDGTPFQIGTTVLTLARKRTRFDHRVSDLSSVGGLMATPAASKSRSSSHGAPIHLMLAEIRANAKLAEEQIWELSYQLKAKTEEAARLRLKMQGQRPVEANGPVEVDNELSAQVAVAQARIKELEGEKLRDIADKTRLVKAVDAHMGGMGATTLYETQHFVRGSKGRAAGKLRSAVSTLPAANVDVLGSAQFFEFSQGALFVALQQLKRKNTCDVERCLLTGVAHTGQRLSMNVVMQSMTQGDFDRL
jgi:hypothetical protein